MSFPAWTNRLVPRHPDRVPPMDRQYYMYQSIGNALHPPRICAVLRASGQCSSPHRAGWVLRHYLVFFSLIFCPFCLRHPPSIFVSGSEAAVSPTPRSYRRPHSVRRLPPSILRINGKRETIAPSFSLGRRFRLHLCSVIITSLLQEPAIYGPCQVRHPPKIE